MLRLFTILTAFAAFPALSQTSEAPIIVHSVSSRSEIQRILNADNLDTANLEARDVADAMATIERGRAPEDFWTAYQTHVRAWQKLADAEEYARASIDGEPARIAGAAALLAEAEEQIEATYTTVERIALDYGARLPIPPAELARTA